MQNEEAAVAVKGKSGGKAWVTERNNQVPLERTCRCCLSSKGLRERDTGVTASITLALIMTLCTASLFFGLLNSNFPVGKK